MITKKARKAQIKSSLLRIKDSQPSKDGVQVKVTSQTYQQVAQLLGLPAKNSGSVPLVLGFLSMADVQMPGSNVVLLTDEDLGRMPAVLNA